MTQGRERIDWEGQWPYHDRPRSWRKWLLARAAREAEWAVPEGTIGDLVRQQRRRASIAQVRTTWVLAALVLTIFAGIVYFVGGPLWKVYADGERVALESTMATALEDANGLTERRNAVRNALVQALEVPGAWFTAAALAQDVSGTVVYRGHALLADGTLVLYGDEGTVLVQSPATARQVAALPTSANDPANPALGSGDLLAFLRQLPPGPRDLPEVLEAAAVLPGLDARQTEIANRYAEAKASLANLWTGQFALERQREDFKTFLATCRGTADPKPGPEGADALTLACLQGWEAQVARDSSTWWKVLAESVPPGILLLFLLATLSALYRYNLRMAGFHDSRADALVMLAMKPSKSDTETLTRISDALAADKVEFGKDNSPADQAVEIFKAFVSRTEK